MKVEVVRNNIFITWKKQDRQCTQDFTLTRYDVTIDVIEKQ
jgi:hypothetical protein